MNRKRITVLLTATIDPKGIAFLKRDDPCIRENDYIYSIKEWILKTDCPIVFCENSGYKIDEIKNMMGKYTKKETEVLQFNGHDFPRELGKGYGELLIIKYALQHSKLIRHSDYIIKVSGRYFINNIEEIVSVLSNNNDIYVMADLRRKLTWADSRVFAFKPSFVRDYLSEFQDMLNDSKGFYFEHALSRATLRALGDGHKCVPLPVKPIVVGINATSDIPYRSNRIRWLAGEIIHRLKNYLNERY